jgi:hypothetical protein
MESTDFVSEKSTLLRAPPLKTTSTLCPQSSEWYLMIGFMVSGEIVSLPSNPSADYGKSLWISAASVCTGSSAKVGRKSLKLVLYVPCSPFQFSTLLAAVIVLFCSFGNSLSRRLESKPHGGDDDWQNSRVTTTNKSAKRRSRTVLKPVAAE